MVDRVLPIVVPGTGTRYYDADDKPAFHGGASVPYPARVSLQEPVRPADLEATLARALHENTHLDVVSAPRCSTSAQDNNAVTVTAADRTVTARYLLGCYGGRSTVRTHLDITMTGRTIPTCGSSSTPSAITTPSASACTRRSGAPTRRRARPGRPLPLRVSALRGRGDPTDTPPFELIARLVSRYREITPEQVERAVNYRFHGLVADDWQLGRCSCSVMPPT